jgi:hypothetical protein
LVKPFNSLATVLGLIALSATMLDIGGVRTNARAANEPAQKAGEPAKPKGSEDASNAREAVKERYPNYGTVVDEQGTPLGGVTVDRLLGGERRISAITDADGKFQLPSAQGFPVYVARHEDGRAGVFDWAQIEKLQSLRITLKPPRAITVHVVDETQAPVEGAQVVVQMYEVLILASGVTDNDGRWTAKLPADAEIGQVFAAKSGSGFDHISASFADGPARYKPLPDKIDLKLAGARTARIKAVDSSGEPIGGASVHAWLIKVEGQERRVNLSGWNFATLTTDASGVAVFDWLPRNVAGAIPFMGSSKGYRSTREVRMGPGAGLADLEMPMVRTSKIVGRVVFSDGRPAPNIRVDARGFGAPYGRRPTTVTAADGSYELAADGELAYVILIDDEHWAATSYLGVLVREGKDVAGIDFTLAEGTIVHGQVTVGPEHHPAPNYYVTLMLKAGEVPLALRKPGIRAYPMFGIRWKSTDGDGKFRFCVGPGTYELGGAAGLKPTTLVVTDQREIVQDVDMPRLLTGLVKDVVKFNVVDDHERPTAGAIVVTTPRSPVFGFPWELEPQASDEFPRPSAFIPLVLQARTPDGRLAGIARIETDDQPRTIRLGPAAIARGRLLDDKGQVAAGVRLRFGIRVYEDEAKKDSSSTISSSGIVTAGQDGGFELRGLVPTEQYVLEYEADPESNRWSLVTTLRAVTTEAVELGDLRLPSAD